MLINQTFFLEIAEKKFAYTLYFWGKVICRNKFRKLETNTLLKKSISKIDFVEKLL
jgi:hypothetical protein